MDFLILVASHASCAGSATPVNELWNLFNEATDRLSLLVFYYFQNDQGMVLARFDLAKTWREFLISFSVPATLFVISFISLCIITRSVKVGDDAKMRCKYCTEGDENSDIDENLANNCGRMDPAAVEEALIAQDAIASTSKVCMPQSWSYELTQLIDERKFSFSVSHSHSNPQQQRATKRTVNCLRIKIRRQ